MAMEFASDVAGVEQYKRNKRRLPTLPLCTVTCTSFATRHVYGWELVILHLADQLFDQSSGKRCGAETSPPKRSKPGKDNARAAARAKSMGVGLHSLADVDVFSFCNNFRSMLSCYTILFTRLSLTLLQLDSSYTSYPITMPLRPAMSPSLAAISKYE